MAEILRLVPKEDGPKEANLSAWLRALADEVDSGEMPASSAAIVFVVDDLGDEGGFCCRMRRHGIHFLGVVGAFQTMLHDMLHVD